jgi:glycogen synthase
MNETHKQILQSIQQAIDSDWHNWQKLSYIRSRIQGLLDQETGPDGRPLDDDRQYPGARDRPGGSIP